MAGRLALIAGRGALPGAVAAAVGEAPLVCALAGNPPDHLTPDRVIQLEKLGSFLRWLKRQGVSDLCLCGGVDRPSLRWWRLEPATLALLPRIRRALARGDDGALRIALDVFEEAGFRVLGAHEVAPELLMPPGTIGTPGTDAEALAALGDGVSADQGRADLGQSCVLRGGQVVTRETESGTDAMLAGLPQAEGRDGILYKAPKPGQDRRVDLPTIGPETVRGAARAGLAGIVIEAGGVIVLDQPEVSQRLAETGLFLWSRERRV